MVQPASPSPPNPQLTQQFLSSVLSQRGPSALPYSEDTKWLIRQHLADSTVPISFHGVTYNIPVVIWLMESYPRHPPCIYVNPMRNMIIKRPQRAGTWASVGRNTRFVNRRPGTGEIEEQGRMDAQ
ncbi:hypothetical protein TIFTF001_019664 [Ficus carica]|uniref:UEV domain-containing protein n=1 Tax=Ficus carica TaxID=3494 RepID=A0AA88AX48_FICCA|nr:hypothetical protein TIFTF001_019664 [Ficus carica]